MKTSGSGQWRAQRPGEPRPWFEGFLAGNAAYRRTPLRWPPDTKKRRESTVTASPPPSRARIGPRDHFAGTFHVERRRLGPPGRHGASSTTLGALMTTSQGLSRYGATAGGLTRRPRGCGGASFHVERCASVPNRACCAAFREDRESPSATALWRALRGGSVIGPRKHGAARALGSAPCTRHTAIAVGTDWRSSGTLDVRSVRRSTWNAR